MADDLQKLAKMLTMDEVYPERSAEMNSPLRQVRVIAGHMSQLPMDRFGQTIQSLFPQSGQWLNEQSASLGDSIAGERLYPDLSSSDPAQKIGSALRELLSGNGSIFSRMR